MPRRDGTGPKGAGSLTGKGFGLCAEENSGVGLGQRLRRACRPGVGRGLGRGVSPNQDTFITQKDLLLKQKEVLNRRMDVIDKQLKNL
jgi:hypothetical protein